MNYTEILGGMRRYYGEGRTQSFEARRKSLEKLEQGLKRWGSRLEQALAEDLGKASMEAYMTELGQVREELRWQKKHLKQNMAVKRAPTPMTQAPAKSLRWPHPYGVVLVMAPWNYPVLLSLGPLVGAVAAGNCVVLKPSAYAPKTAETLAAMVSEVFAKGHVQVVTGGRAENQALLEQRFDYIFFTGGTQVGKLVLEKAVRHLTPVTLELGGKSPCIVAEDADLSLTARRIVFGKLVNCGQTCVAPDYVLAPKGKVPALVEEMKKQLLMQLGSTPLNNPEYPRIVNGKHYRRLMGLLEGARIETGGRGDERTLRIEPTILTGVTEQSPVMQEEIFGPILPVVEYDTFSQVLDFVAERPHPLALYLFTRSRKTARQVMDRLQFGGGCINDTLVHLASSHLPFGGVGESGMGAYHGQKSFDTFTHYRSVLSRGKVENPLRYHPYTPKKEKLLRRFLG